MSDRVQSVEGCDNCDCGKISTVNLANGPTKVEIGDEPKYICRCGQSANYPYCDGTHKKINKEKGTSFSPFKACKETCGDKSEIYVCCCGLSNKRKEGLPFCDGSHKTLGPRKKEKIPI